jgi:hypothetical protein
MGNEMRKSWLPAELTPGVTLSNGPPEVSGFEASWERFRAEAEAVDAGEVKTFPYSAGVVLHNVRTGVAAVVAERPWFDAQPDAPRVDYARLGEAEVAAEALAFTADQAAALVRTPPTLTVKIKRARVLVRALDTGAAALVAMGQMRADEIPATLGRGPIATARRCVTLAALFRGKHARTRGVTAVTSAIVKEASDLGSELQRILKPKGVGKRNARSEAEVAASDARDRMAVVVARRYGYVERIAGFRWGRELGAYVPTMLSRDTSSGGSAAEDVDAEEEDVAEEEEADDEATDDTIDAVAEEEAADEEDAADEEEADEPAVAAPVAPKKRAVKKVAEVKKGAAAKKAKKKAARDA